MKTIRKHIKSVFRFRHWSRKSYAMFRSIGICVNIGTLQNQAAQISLAKQQGYSESDDQTDGSCTDRRTPDPEITDILLSGLFEPVLCSWQTVSHPENAGQEYIRSDKRRIRRFTPLDATFFIYKSTHYAKRIA